MIDIKFLRENPEIVKENIRKKFAIHCEIWDADSDSGAWTD